jgi:thiol:disulfide interchange protein|tara:strand:+ start:3695 stop:5614 length:1920 start_codon:yes stop_codon:yes gene_type:complete
MFNYIISYVIFSVGVCFSQVVNPVVINVQADSSVRAGEVVNININAEMDSQWKIYSIYEIVDGPLATEIGITGEVISSIAKVIEPNPTEKYDPGFDVTSFYHSGDTQFSAQILLKNDLVPGVYEISVRVYYQVCNERLCYPPTEKLKKVLINVLPGEPREGKTTLIVSKNNEVEKSKVNSFLNLIIIAIGGAILSWVMPCVYPMIPIIISFFGKVSEDKNIGKFSVATLYGSGIAGTFVFIGLLVSFLSWGINDAAVQTGYANIGNFIATNAWLNLGLGLLFIFFALWMFGVVNVNVAGALLSKTDKAGQSAKNAYFGAFILGIAFAITSFSCTVPVVGMLLVVAASGTATGLLTSLLGMTVYGVVFAFPFVILSLFPSSLDKLPRSGVWMEKAKVVFGFVELAAAVKFLWVPDIEWGLGLLPRNVVLGLFLLIGLLLILYLAGIFSIQKGFQNNRKEISYIGIIITSLVLLPVGLSLFSGPTFHYNGLPRFADELIEAMVPPPPTEDEIAMEEGWFVDDYDGALELAKKEGRPLFIDFTGIYCANCRVMERRIFPLEKIKNQFDNMVLARLYVDKKDSLSAIYAQMQFERYKTATQPYYVILDPQNESTLADTGGYIPNGFDRFLSKGIEQYHIQNRR